MTKKRPAIGTTPVKSRVPVDVTDATFKANPFPFYAQLRAASPVFLVKLPTKQHAWLITRYDDVLNVLKDERFAKDRQNAMTPEQLKKLPWIPPMFKPRFQLPLWAFISVGIVVYLLDTIIAYRLRAAGDEPDR